MTEKRSLASVVSETRFARNRFVEHCGTQAVMRNGDEKLCGQ